MSRRERPVAVMRQERPQVVGSCRTVRRPRQDAMATWSAWRRAKSERVRKGRSQALCRTGSSSGVSVAIGPVAAGFALDVSGALPGGERVACPAAGVDEDGRDFLLQPLTDGYL